MWRFFIPVLVYILVLPLHPGFVSPFSAALFCLLSAFHPSYFLLPTRQGELAKTTIPVAVDFIRQSILNQPLTAWLPSSLSIRPGRVPLLPHCGIAAQPVSIYPTALTEPHLSTCDSCFLSLLSAVEAIDESTRALCREARIAIV